MTDRVIALKLFFNCFHKEHFSKNCKSKTLCRHHGVTHHTSLCAAKISSLTPTFPPITATVGHPQSLVAKSMFKSEVNTPNALGVTSAVTPSKTNVTIVNLASNIGLPSSTIPMALVTVSSYGREVTAHEFLGTSSQKSFINPRLVKQPDFAISNVLIQNSAFSTEAYPKNLHLVKVKIKFGCSKLLFKVLTHNHVSMEITCPGMKM